MRIAVVNNFFPPRPGGSAHLADLLATQYAAAGHQVLVLTAAYDSAAPYEHRTDGVQVIRIPSWTLPKTPLAANFDIGFTLSPRSRRRVFEALDNFKPDVIHQHGQFFDLTWQSGWWARARGIPTLLSIHTRLESPLSALNSAIYRLADSLLVAPMMRWHKPSIVVMDRLMQSYIRERYRGAYLAEFNIPVGIDVSRFSAGNSDKGRHYAGVPDKIPLILSVGHVIPQRSRIPLVEALPDVLEVFPNAKVFVAGGIYHDEFLRVADRLGVRDAIIAPGSVPRTVIQDLLAAATLEVHELQGEGFGTASLEALGAGVPIVAAVSSDNFIDVEITDGEQLHLVPIVHTPNPVADSRVLAMKIIAILESPDEARRVASEHGFPFVAEHFSIERVAEQHLDVLAKLAACSEP